MSQNRKRRRQMPRLKKSASNIEQPPLPWHAELLEQGTSHIPAQQRQTSRPQLTAAIQTKRRVQKKVPAGTWDIGRKTTNIDDWFEANGPCDPVDTCALFDAFINRSDETRYEVTEDADGTIFVTSHIEPKTLVLRSTASQDSFMRTLEGYKNDKDWDFDEERDFYIDVNNPNS